MQNLLRTVLLNALFFSTIFSFAHADEPISPSKSKSEEGVQWYDAALLDVEGRAFADLKAPYDRLPARAEGVVRDAVWGLSRHSAGECVRFITDAPSFSARWTLISDRLAMPHMPATGVSGLDLYVRNGEGEWRWLSVGQPTQTTNTAKFTAGSTAAPREFMLYFPLYNGVSSVEIGLPEGAKLFKGPEYPADHAKPIVFYGTSITQGGCASRPGMVHTAILSRRLKRPVINLGFSGNGRMEAEVAQFIAEIDAAVYVIDCLPNMDAAAVSANTAPLVKQLQAAHPETPILLVEDRSYANSQVLDGPRVRNETNRAALLQEFEKLIDGGVQGIYYLTGDKLLGKDGEDTVDGSHPTDFGFWRHANAFEPLLREILDENQ
ncbi:MAG: SGNH/GDSL hydrolase family protein [Planctomycetota bacterium]|nr:SGNH/GDSL hydrolase family protein [Planctomycetota bacterium]MDA1211145.1 SGNH/GDSL hydrolase family protein [Planctomycetota bacterium]